MSKIIIVTEQASAIDQGVISLEVAMKRRIQRRRRVAKRLALRAPLFAVELMQQEFPGYNLELFEADLTRKTRKGRSFRRPKSPLSRMGRYPLMLRALYDYRQTRDVEKLAEAQRLRNRMHLNFEVVFGLGGGKRLWLSFPPETNWPIVEAVTKIKYTTREELEAELDKQLKYVHFGRWEETITK